MVSKNFFQIFDEILNILADLFHKNYFESKKSPVLFMSNSPTKVTAENLKHSEIHQI